MFSTSESTLVLYKSLLNGPFPHLAVKLEQEINSSEVGIQRYFHVTIV